MASSAPKRSACPQAKGAVIAPNFCSPKIGTNFCWTFLADARQDVQGRLLCDFEHLHDTAMRLVQRARPGELPRSEAPTMCSISLTSVLHPHNRPQLSSAAAAVSFSDAASGATSLPKAGWRIVNVIEGSPLEAAAAVSRVLIVDVSDV